MSISLNKPVELTLANPHRNASKLEIIDNTYQV